MLKNYFADTLEFGEASENLPVVRGPSENLNFELLLEKRSEKIKIDEELAKKEDASDEECEFDPYDVHIAALPLRDDVSNDDVIVTCENERANRLFVKCEFVENNNGI